MMTTALKLPWNCFIYLFIYFISSCTTSLPVINSKGYLFVYHVAFIGKGYFLHYSTMPYMLLHLASSPHMRTAGVGGTLEDGGWWLDSNISYYYHTG